MRANPVVIDEVIKMKTQYLVRQLCNRGMPEDSAIIAVTRSETYAMLMNKRTKYFTESYESLLDMLLCEINVNE